jgi:hypothetical protein
MQTISFPEHAVRRISQQSIKKAPPGAVDWLIGTLKFSAVEMRRMKALNRKVREGKLSEQEAVEADGLIAMGQQLDRLRAEALLAEQLRLARKSK